MIIKCPSCETRFNLPDEKFQEGRKVRCSKCKHVFPLAREPQAAPPAAPVPPAPAPGYSENDAQEAMSYDMFAPAPPSRPASYAEEPRSDFFDDPGGAGMASPGFSPDAEVMRAVQESAPSPFDFEVPGARAAAAEPPGEDTFSQMFSQEIAPEDPYDIDETAKLAAKTSPRLSIPKAQAPKRSPLKVAISLFLFIFLAVTAAGVLAWFFVPDMLPAPVRELLSDLSEPQQNASSVPGEPLVNQDMVKHLELKDAEQHFVKNEKVGELLVIQGQVVNNSPEPRELIKVEANLYDENGVRLDTRQQLIGNAISLFQLQQLNREELEKALNNPVGITTQNTNIKPGATAPFMVIFYEPSPSVKEYQVVIVDAKSPPKQ